ncbi:MAG: hypothetical protein C6W57_10570 [Caldibacillus debilis]|nr:MAG: hypothetical protein C6W57_10570 [Caldibacillus debilis]
MFRGKKGCSAEKTSRIAFSRSDICGKKCLLAEKQVLLPPSVRTTHEKNDGGKGGGPGTDFRKKGRYTPAEEEKAALCGSLDPVCAGETIFLKKIRAFPPVRERPEHGIGRRIPWFCRLFLSEGKVPMHYRMTDELS